MIRINLLPVREAQVRGKGKQIITLFVVLLLLEAGGLFFYQSEQQAELQGLQASNNKIAKEIQKLKKETAKVAGLEQEQAELEQQKTVLDSLIEGQSGPVRLLDELSSLLTPIVEPEEKLRVQNLGWNAEWDPKKLWIESFIEDERRVKILGIARTNEDLAEFLQRLESSKHFVEINLNFSEAIEVSELNDARLVRFDIEALALYGPADVKKLAAGELGVDKKKRH